MIDKNRLKEIVDQLCRYNYWFCNEMMKYEEENKKFEKACEEAKECGEHVCIMSFAANNAKCMKGCMQGTVKLINFLCDKKEQDYIEPWQLAGAEAILTKCKEDKIVPFDLPGVLMAVFGMWNELE